MEIVKGNIEVKREARYYTNGASPLKAESIWFLLHGYGQLAENFLKKFHHIDNESTLLAAPEALSRFYTDGGFGKIGASWMTREERESEIAGYVNYLSSLHKHFKVECGNRKIPLNVFSFSQGTSTACRWLQLSGIKASLLILWGGFLPPDFDLARWNDSFERLLIVTGTEDNFFTPTHLAKGKKQLDEVGADYEVYVYEGVHEMSAKEVNHVFKNIVRQ